MSLQPADRRLVTESRFQVLGDELYPNKNSVVSKGELFVNATDLGADPTGVNSSVEAIQLALTEAPLDSTVILPEGEYLLDSTLTIPEHSKIKGTRGATLKFTGPGVALAVEGQVEGLILDYQGGTGLNDVAVWVLPNTVDARVSGVIVTGMPGSAFAVGGAEDTSVGAGKAIRPVLESCFATDAAQYAYRIDACDSLLLDRCVATGAGLDTVKLRVHVGRLEMYGGDYSGARMGDGIDGFAGANRILIQGSSFHDSAHNGAAFKTDDDATGTMTVEELRESMGWTERLILSDLRCYNNGGGGLTVHRTDGLDSDILTNDKSYGQPMGTIITNLQAWNNNNDGLALNVRGAYVSGAHLSNNALAATGAVGQMRIYPEARDITLHGVYCYGSGNLPDGFNDDFILMGQRIYLSGCHSVGVSFQHLQESKDDLQASRGDKLTRFGFRIGDGADIHLHQCSARWNRTAPLSVTLGKVTFDECEFLQSDGRALWPGTDGRTYKDSQVVGWRRTVGDTVQFSTALSSHVESGGKTWLRVGDSSVSGFDYISLLTKAGGQVSLGTNLVPTANNSVDLGLNGVKFRNLNLAGLIRSGVNQIDIQSNPPRWTSDGGASWTPMISDYSATAFTELQNSVASLVQEVTSLTSRLDALTEEPA